MFVSQRLPRRDKLGMAETTTVSRVVYDYDAHSKSCEVRVGEQDRLDTCHRSVQRYLLNRLYPIMFSNEELTGITGIENIREKVCEDTTL